MELLLVLLAAGGLAVLIWRAMHSAASLPVSRPAASTPDIIDEGMGKVLVGNLALNWRIEYQDNNGVVTTRDIIVRELIGRKYPHYARAFCLLRKEVRHFQLYRMSGVLQDGAPIKNPQEYADLLWREHIGEAPRGTAAEKLATERRTAQPGVTLGIRTEQGTFHVEVVEYRVTPQRIVIRGKAHRLPTEQKKAWRGAKTFYLSASDEVFDIETGELIPDVDTALLAPTSAP